jgi:curved DNA-binding protein CbpA
VNDWYEVLGVRPDASPEEIAAAYARLVPEERQAGETEDQAEERRLREYAYGVLSNPDSRRSYDEERGRLASASQAPAPAAGTAPKSGFPIIGVLAGLGVILVVAAIAAGVFLLARGDDGRDYPDKGDDDYDLEAMRLFSGDLPSGFEHTGSLEFNNEDWSPLFFSADELQQGEALDEELSAKQRQLDAEGRLRGYWSAYQSTTIGRTILLFSLSTLYTDEQAAEKSLDLYCGLPFRDNQDVQVRALSLPKIGDSSAGFMSESVVSGQFGIILQFDIPPVYSDSNYCFRTGRVVHAVSMMSVPGADDVALGVRLARKMEARVNDFYDGKPAPADDSADNGG